jgi:hypothetical protein
VSELIGEKEVSAAYREQLGAIAAGLDWGAYCRAQGVDPRGLRRWSASFLEEPFARLHTLGALQEGALRSIGLTRSQRNAVKEELASTAELGFVAGVTAARAGR